MFSFDCHLFYCSLLASPPDHTHPQFHPFSSCHPAELRCKVWSLVPRDLDSKEPESCHLFCLRSTYVDRNVCLGLFFSKINNQLLGFVHVEQLFVNNSTHHIWKISQALLASLFKATFCDYFTLNCKIIFTVHWVNGVSVSVTLHPEPGLSL